MSNHQKGLTLNIMPDKELSIVACASDTIKQLNRDACSILFNEKLNFKGIVVTDGIGSNENVQKASRFAVDFIKEEFEKFHCIEQVIFDEAFKDLKSEFNKAFGSEVSNHHFGTTIISAIEYVVEGKRRIRFAFLGNGAIWHIKGNSNHFLDL